ncbi:hypothetical protein ACIBAI_20400 [Streptomyces sp. NPDC051041]|uniref:hypothetical protein n=1 Tax=Streptomyces sp. NPDC051041 TaxID=3365640 RepID=UPI003798FCB3
MPFATPPRAPSGPRRRSLLASTAGAALLVGCSDGSGNSGGTGGSPSAAARVRARAARDSERLAARYDAVIAAHPGLAERLRPLREEVVRHAEAFGGGRGGVGAPSSAPPSGSPSAPASGSPSVSAPATGPGDGPGAVPKDARDALAALAADERTLADRRAGALLDVPGELARLLASVAAAGAAHVYLLTEGDG